MVEPKDSEIIAAIAAATAANARLVALEMSYQRMANRLTKQTGNPKIGAEWAALSNLVKRMRHLHREDGLGMCIRCVTECPCEHWQLLLAVAEAVDI
jgi:hypothetical protein